MLRAIQRMAEKHPQQIAVEDRGEHISYRVLWARVQECSAWMSGERPNAVGIALEDSASWIVVHLACLHAGIVQVPVPAFFTKSQREHALRQAGASMVLSSEKSATKVPLVGHDDIYANPLYYPDAVLPKGTALITYTSGSTGTPKGVCLSLQGMQQVAQSLVDALGSDTCARHLSVLPLAVLLEQIGGLYSVLFTGGTYVISGVQRDPMRLRNALHESQATSCILVPEMLKLLVHQQSASRAPLEHLRFAAVGGARVSEALMAETRALGLPVYEGYGLTEAASVVAVNTPAHHCPGTVGTLLPHIDCLFADDGEIILNHPAMLGYVGDAAPCTRFATGDIGTVDADGYLHIIGRKKNLLITSAGRNVAPEWPESLLASQPEVAQAMVYGDGEAQLSAFLVPSSAAQAKYVPEAVLRVNAMLPEYARIAHWQLSEPFTPANGMLTGNGRVRRDCVLQTHFPKGMNDGFLRSTHA